MKSFVLSLLLSVTAFTVQGQSAENIWFFGGKVGGSTADFGTIRISVGSRITVRYAIRSICRKIALWSPNQEPGKLSFIPTDSKSPIVRIS